ncbi:MAG: hypothetical protein WCT15_06585, partial [Candidatus Omnitrophota bacterium]
NGVRKSVADAARREREKQEKEIKALFESADKYIDQASKALESKDTDAAAPLISNAVDALGKLTTRWQLNQPVDGDKLTVLQDRIGDVMSVRGSIIEARQERDRSLADARNQLEAIAKQRRDEDAKRLEEQRRSEVEAAERAALEAKEREAAAQAAQQKRAAAVETVIHKENQHRYAVTRIASGQIVLTRDFRILGLDIYAPGEVIFDPAQVKRAEFYTKGGKEYAKLDGHTYRVERNVMMVWVRSRDNNTRVIRSEKDLAEYDKKGYQFFVATQGGVEERVMLDQVLGRNIGGARVSPEELMRQTVTYKGMRDNKEYQVIVGVNDVPFRVAVQHRDVNGIEKFFKGIFSIFTGGERTDVMNDVRPDKLLTDPSDPSRRLYAFNYPRGAEYHYYKRSQIGHLQEISQDNVFDMREAVVLEVIDGRGKKVRYDLFNATALVVNAENGRIDIGLTAFSGREKIAQFRGQIVDASGKRVYPLTQITERPLMKPVMDLYVLTAQGLEMRAGNGEAYNTLSFGPELGGQELITLATSGKTGIIISASAARESPLMEGWTYYDEAGMVLNIRDQQLIAKARRATQIAPDGSRVEWKLKPSVFIAVREKDKKLVSAENIKEFVDDFINDGFTFTVPGQAAPVVTDSIVEAHNEDLAYGTGSAVTRELNRLGIPDVGTQAVKDKEVYKITQASALPSMVMIPDNRNVEDAISIQEVVFDARGLTFLRKVNGREIAATPETAQFARDGQGKKYTIIRNPKGLWTSDTHIRIIRHLEDLANLARRGFEVRDAKGTPVYSMKEARGLANAREFNNAMFYIFCEATRAQHRMLAEEARVNGGDPQTMVALANTSPQALVRVANAVMNGAGEIDKAKSGFFRVLASVGIATEGKPFAGASFQFTIDRTRGDRIAQGARIAERGRIEIARGRIDDALKYYTLHNSWLESRHVRALLIEVRDQMQKDLASGIVEESARLETSSRISLIEKKIADMDKQLVDIENALRDLVNVRRGEALPISDQEMTPQDFVAMLKAQGILGEGVDLTVFEQELNMLWAKHRLAEAMKGPWSKISFGVDVGFPFFVMPFISFNRSGGLKSFELTKARAYLEKARAEISLTSDIDKLRDHKIALMAERERMREYSAALEDWLKVLNRSVEEMRVSLANANIPAQDLTAMQERLIETSQAAEAVRALLKNLDVEYETALKDLDKAISKERAMPQRPKTELLSATNAVNAAMERYDRIGQGAQQTLRSQL